VTQGGMKMPRPTEQAKERFSALVPDEPAITLKPMFGNLAAFVNGNMFSGLFGDGLFVRLPDGEAEAVIKKGGKWFEPMAGHRMGGYVMVAGDWQKKPETVKPLIARALTLTRAMPAKAKKPAAKKAAASTKKR
jgi:TfoX/Sxy family transcriptional regulator of competence genes